VITALLAAYGAVLLAELPDKTMFAALVLTTRYRRPLAVWLGAVSAFAFHVVLAVTVGSFLERLPERPTQLAVGLLFLVGAVLLWREDGEAGADTEDTRSVERIGAGTVFLRSAGVLLIAEFGDLTQLATAGLAASTGEPLAVAIGAWAALATVAALAVLAGSWIERKVPLRTVRRVGAVVFAGFGLVAVVTAIIG
jgi:putative Ca2+/H+ antiporter (TMEM165/GDT1 family)